MALPSLSTAQIRKIEVLIEAWRSKLTWALLVDRIESELDIKTTRQTLNTYKSIKNAYDEKKVSLRGKVTQEFIQFTKADIDTHERITRLESENKVLKSNLDKQLALISAINSESENNPLLTELLLDVKRKITRGR